MSNITIECKQTPTNSGAVVDVRPGSLLTPDFLSNKDYRTEHGFGTALGAPMTTKRILLAPRPLSRRG